MLRFLCLCPGGRLTEQLAEALIRSPMVWELEEVRSIAEAESRILESEFHVVVAEAPGLTGEHAEFLRGAIRRNPEITPFLVLPAPVSEQQQPFEQLNVLVAPVDITELLCVSQRTQSLRDVLNSDRVFRTVANIKQLPTFPKMYQQLSQLIESESCSCGQLATVLRHDPAICARVLQAANSAYYGMARQVAAVEQAISVLGFATLKNIVMATEVMASISRTGATTLDLERLWLHSYEVGERAARIVREVFGYPPLADAAFAAGLLHDIGKVIIARALGPLWELSKVAAERDGIPLFEAERQIIGAHHGEIGAFLLSLWNLPAVIVEAVAFHHDPEPPPSARPSVVSAVFVANRLVTLSPDATTLGCNEAGIDYLRHIGFSDALECWDASHRPEVSA